MKVSTISIFLHPRRPVPSDNHIHTLQMLSDVSTLSNQNSANDVDIWHRRLGHPQFSTVKSILQLSKYRVNINKMHFCEACALRKHHALLFTLSLNVYTCPLQLVVCDLWRLAYVTSRNGFRYYISFMDVYSRYTWIYFLNSKSEAFTAFQKFKILVVKLLRIPTLHLQTDWGGGGG